jgi:hypothetical protein
VGRNRRTGDLHPFNGPVSLTLGGTLYGIDDLTDVTSPTREKFKYYFESLAQITFTNEKYFSPTLIFWREFGRLNDNYVEFSLSHSVDLNKQCRVGFRPYVGVYEPSRRYYGADISLRYLFSRGFYGRATVALVKNNFPQERHEHASFGVGAGYSW